MLGTEIALNQHVALRRHEEFIAEAMRQHEIDIAFGENRLPRADRLVELRTTVATALLRAGARLMPEGSVHPAIDGLELQPGR